MTMNLLERAAEWTESYGAVASLAGNFLLVIITAWYALLTMRLAKSSNKAAKAAQSSADSAMEAALSAKTSALASISSVGVDYFCVPLYMRVDQRNVFCGVALKCNAAAAFIHSIRLVDASTSTSVPGKTGSKILLSVAENLEVMPLNELPRRLHPGAVLYFYLDSDAQREAWISWLKIEVSYSFDEYVVMSGLPLSWHDVSDNEIVFFWSMTPVPGGATARVGRPPFEGEHVPIPE